MTHPSWQRSTPRFLLALVLALALLAGPVAVSPALAAAADRPTPTRQLTAALLSTSAYHNRNGFELYAVTPGRPPLQVTRKGTVAQFRSAGETTMTLTPAFSYHAVGHSPHAEFVTAARGAGRDWLRYPQFTPQALPDPLTLVGLASLPQAKVTVATRGSWRTYEIVPKGSDPRRWTVQTRSEGPELVTKVVLRDRGGQHLQWLDRVAGVLQAAPTGKTRITTFVLTAAVSAPGLPAASAVLDPASRTELHSADRYDADTLERLAREILFAANRMSEAVNRTLTGVELNRTLSGYLPHEFPGLQLRAVGDRLELTVLRPEGASRRCALLTRFDYTTESLLLRDGPC